METLTEKIRALPKVELHLHIDGSVRPKTVSELLNLPLPEVEEKMMVSKETHSLTDYLTKFDLPIEAMQTKENLKRITKELLDDLKEEHVIYAELRFAPMFHTKKRLTQEEVVDTVWSSMKEVEGIQSNLILCCMRHDIENGNIHNFETIELANKWKDRRIALDLAGDESKYPTILFEELFQKIRAYDLPFTIHAGEASDYHSIEAALSFGAKRIGHGIRASENSALMEQLQHNHVILEVCPDSNVDTMAVLKKQDHPIFQLYHHVLVTVNTDNRTVSQINLTDEYRDLIELFHFTWDDLKKININAIKGAFIDEKEKQILYQKIEEGYHDTTY